MATKDHHVGKGFGFTDEKGVLYLQRCFECGKENWMVMVPTGQCYWCHASGYNSIKDAR